MRARENECINIVRCTAYENAYEDNVTNEHQCLICHNHTNQPTCGVKLMRMTMNWIGCAVFKMSFFKSIFCLCCSSNTEKNITNCLFRLKLNSMNEKSWKIALKIPILTKFVCRYLSTITTGKHWTKDRSYSWYAVCITHTPQSVGVSHGQLKSLSVSASVCMCLWQWPMNLVCR